MLIENIVSHDLREFLDSQFTIYRITNDLIQSKKEKQSFVHYIIICNSKNSTLQKKMPNCLQFDAQSLCRLHSDCAKEIHIGKHVEFEWKLGWRMLHVNCMQLIKFFFCSARIKYPTALTYIIQKQEAFLINYLDIQASTSIEIGLKVLTRGYCYVRVATPSCIGWQVNPNLKCENLLAFRAGEITIVVYSNGYPKSTSESSKIGFRSLQKSHKCGCPHGLLNDWLFLDFPHQIFPSCGKRPWLVVIHFKDELTQVCIFITLGKVGSLLYKMLQSIQNLPVVIFMALSLDFPKYDISNKRKKDYKLILKYFSLNVENIKFMDLGNLKKDKYDILVSQEHIPERLTSYLINLVFYKCVFCEHLHLQYFITTFGFLSLSRASIRWVGLEPDPQFPQPTTRKNTPPTKKNQTPQKIAPRTNYLEFMCKLVEIRKNRRKSRTTRKTRE
ncbi:hypothetical protein VP01_1137g2 [Puccinia sorghi]|uniref:Uncharacterized protein n=1 Tax=Puccinia sorghi TaxID=27349 RepID=A0A0L6VTF5_9BASI|nr:hypothetical protein VP01_1137g2 [Puccinia sorghi]